MYEIRSIECGEKTQQQQQQPQPLSSDSMSVTTRRRRLFQRQACIFSVMAAFILGLALGVFVPIFGLGAALSEMSLNMSFVDSSSSSNYNNNNSSNRTSIPLLETLSSVPNVHFPTIYDLQRADSRSVKESYAVSFLNEEKYTNSKENSIADGYFGKNKNEIELTQSILSNSNDYMIPVDFVKESQQNTLNNFDDRFQSILFKGIFWGEQIEQALPKGFNKVQTDDWNSYISNHVITKLEVGCGRMQNRMVIFEDGTRACARYRQNTDQIQGELFSFYFGQLLNLTNLAPSAASIIDLNSNTWHYAAQDILNAQWKSFKPVVLTKWLPDLEPSGIPGPFQSQERHLNKFDVYNITLGKVEATKKTQSLINHLGVPDKPQKVQKPAEIPKMLKKTLLTKFVELAQWSDLIVFDYLIANLDRVVNNLYNYQWNADIMAAPAHNLARQKQSQLLVFLDNESGLLHGYRLLKKYEAYHGLLIDNLCVFRSPTIKALQELREQGVGSKLQQLFETSTSLSIRDVLPPLPDKSIKILNDRIDRVLGQVQKCSELFSSR